MTFHVQKVDQQGMCFLNGFHGICVVKLIVNITFLKVVLHAIHAKKDQLKHVTDNFSPPDLWVRTYHERSCSKALKADLNMLEKNDEVLLIYFLCHAVTIPEKGDLKINFTREITS